MCPNFSINWKSGWLNLSFLLCSIISSINFYYNKSCLSFPFCQEAYLARRNHNIWILRNWCPYEISQCEYTHPLQQVGRCRPGAGQVLNEELRPVVVFLLDGCRETKKKETEKRTNNQSVVSEHTIVLLCHGKLFIVCHYVALLSVVTREQHAWVSACICKHKHTAFLLIQAFFKADTDLIKTADVKYFNNECLWIRSFLRKRSEKKFKYSVFFPVKSLWSLDGFIHTANINAQFWFMAEIRYFLGLHMQKRSKKRHLAGFWRSEHIRMKNTH